MNIFSSSLLVQRVKTSKFIAIDREAHGHVAQLPSDGRVHRVAPGAYDERRVRVATEVLGALDGAVGVRGVVLEIVTVRRLRRPVLAHPAADRRADLSKVSARQIVQLAPYTQQAAID